MQNIRKITVIDYGLNNINSISRALDYIGVKFIVSANPKIISSSDYLILPGVGSFPDGMKSINENELLHPIKLSVEKGKPLLGICLGMQMLFDKSFENIETNGFGFIKGKVKKIRTAGEGIKRKVPHVGWNRLIFTNKKESTKIFENKYMYFVHSFMAMPKFKSNIASYIDYKGLEIPAIVKQDNVVGVQFHPEKSGKYGLQLLDSIINY